jgi:AAT family amino acid transporter
MGDKMKQSEDKNLKRCLSERHIRLIAIGGTIGIGLFLASGNAISCAGPSLLISYAIGGIFVYFIMRALGEITVEDPISGSFSVYANKFISPCAGFIVGWSYWFLWVVSSMAEITAIGIFCSFWWPELPQWITALVFLICVTLTNLVDVESFGELEFWCSLIKVITIIGLIIVGILTILFGIGNSGHAVGISNLYALKGGFFPFGIKGVLLALTVTTFSFIGVEFIGITAGETKNPEKSIPAAINKVMLRVSLLYIGTLFVIMCIYPWMSIVKSGGVTESPFVSAFAGLGVKQAASIINFVLITASLSACNSGMFGNGRMLYNLALQRQAPQFLARVSSRKVPANAIITSFTVALIGVVLNFIAPKSLFMALVSVITFLALWIWAVIVIVQMRSRCKMNSEDIAKLKYPMPFYPYSNYIALLALLVTAVMLAIGKTTRMTVIIGPIWLITIYIIYKMFVKEKGSQKTSNC